MDGTLPRLQKADCATTSYFTARQAAARTTQQLFRIDLPQLLPSRATRRCRTASASSMSLLFSTLSASSTASAAATTLS